ncbi:MAG: hypothetical protein RL662_1733 [Bacteroidota bacterium]
MSTLAVMLCLILGSASAQEQEKSFQLSFIAPFGTNGTQSHLITNKVSINLLGGYSYGNKGFELGGGYNVNTHITKGLQIAGIANYSGNSENAVQIAGITNISGDGSVIAQIGGILNVAKKVKGLQIGLINYADESDGLPIGLISIVKKGGKQEFEVSFSESLNTAVSFKLGTDRLYTIFSGGVNYAEKPLQYAAGLGFGTHVNWKNGWGNQIEIMGYALTENESFKIDGINMLAQFKLMFSKQLASHFKMFAGPVLNMTISDYTNPETGELGSSLSPWSMWKNDSQKTQLNAWVGLSAGVRF